MTFQAKLETPQDEDETYRDKTAERLSGGVIDLIHEYLQASEDTRQKTLRLLISKLTKEDIKGLLEAMGIAGMVKKIIMTLPSLRKP